MYRKTQNAQSYYFRNAVIAFSKPIRRDCDLRLPHGFTDRGPSCANTAALSVRIATTFSNWISVAIAGTSAFTDAAARCAKFSPVGLDHSLQRPSL